MIKQNWFLVVLPLLHMIKLDSGFYVAKYLNCSVVISWAAAPVWPPTNQWLYFGSLLKKININKEFFFVWRVRTSSHLTRYSLLQFLTELLVVTFFPHYLLMSQAWSGSSYNLSRKIKVVSQT